MKGLLIALGKPKGAPSKEKEEEEGAEKSYAREAFAALKEDDEEGFVEAFLGAVRACAAKEY
jgi:hypothetical protein